MWKIIDFNNLCEKFGLAASWINTFDIPLFLYKYFNALNVDCCLVFPPAKNFTFFLI